MASEHTPSPSSRITESRRYPGQKMRIITLVDPNNNQPLSQTSELFSKLRQIPLEDHRRNDFSDLIDETPIPEPADKTSHILRRMIHCFSFGKCKTG